MNKLSECMALLAIFISGTVMAQTEIRTVEELAAISSHKDLMEQSYLLMNDLTLDNWIPIGGIDGNEDNGFSGVFDGNGHTITINSFHMELDNTHVGLFGLINEAGIVKRLRVNGRVEYTGGQKFLYIGGIAGFNKGLITCCASSIDLTCQYMKAEQEKKIKPQFGYESGNFGGCIAGINLGIIIHCYSTGSIYVFQGYAGGIAAGNGKPVKGSIGLSVGSGGVGISMSPGAMPHQTGGIAYCYSSSSVSSMVDNAGRPASRYLLGSAGGIVAAFRPETATMNNCVSLNRLIESKGDYKPKASPFPRFGGLALTHSNFQFYYQEGMVTRRYNAKGKELKPEKISPKRSVSSSELQRSSWWCMPDESNKDEKKNNISFPFGEDEESPWKWSDNLKRPILYWETDELTPVP